MTKMRCVKNLTLALLLFVSVFLYAYSASVSSERNLNETNSLSTTDGFLSSSTDDVSPSPTEGEVLIKEFQYITKVYIKECGCAFTGLCYLDKSRNKCDCPLREYSKKCNDCPCGASARASFIRNYYGGTTICSTEEFSSREGCTEKEFNCSFEDGWCRFSLNGYGLCVPYLSGKHGKCVASPCLPNPCKNDGECIEDVTAEKGFTCNCFGEFKGDTCEHTICDKDKCVHGICEEVGNTFECRCDKGFAGQRCEEKILTKSNTPDLWMALLLTGMSAIILLLSCMFCFWTRILIKMSKK